MTPFETLIQLTKIFFAVIFLGIAMFIAKDLHQLKNKIIYGQIKTVDIK